MRKNIIIMSVSLFITVSMLVFATFAWQTTNRNTPVDGMNFNASTSTNIVICSSPENLDLNNPFSIQLAMPESHTITRFVPATHTDDSDTLLKYASEVTEIDKNTGLKTSVGELTFENVQENENSRFYVDYSFYIASYSTKALNQATLTASFLNEQDRESYLGGSSIDFYVNDEYKDTLNIAGFDPVVNNHTTEKTVADLGVLDIPVYTDSEYIKITIRCYFDGALLKSTGYTFITQEAVKESEFSQIDLDVRFTVTGGTIAQ